MTDIIEQLRALSYGERLEAIAEDGSLLDAVFAKLAEAQQQHKACLDGYEKTQRRMFQARVECDGLRHVLGDCHQWLAALVDHESHSDISLDDILNRLETIPQDDRPKGEQ